MSVVIAASATTSAGIDTTWGSDAAVPLVGSWARRDNDPVDLAVVGPLSKDTFEALAGPTEGDER